MISINALLGTPQLTQPNGVLPENLTSAKLDRKFPAFYGIRRFITAIKECKKIICRVPLPAGSRYSLSSHSPSTGGNSKGIKWPERETDHPPLLCAVIKNTWGCTSIHCTFKIQCLTTHDTPTLLSWLISCHTERTATVVASSVVKCSRYRPGCGPQGG